MYTFSQSVASRDYREHSVMDAMLRCAQKSGRSGERAAEIVLLSRHRRYPYWHKGAVGGPHRNMFTQSNYATAGVTIFGSGDLLLVEAQIHGPHYTMLLL